MAPASKKGIENQTETETRAVTYLGTTHAGRISFSAVKGEPDKMENRMENWRSKFHEMVKTNVEYGLLPYQFLLLTFWGIWCPKDWPKDFKRMQNIYYHAILILDLSMCVQMLIHFFMTIGTDEFKLLNFFFVSANITAVYKSIKLQRNREVIRAFIRQYFNDTWLIANDHEERRLRDETDLRIRNVTITYFVSMLAIVLLKAMTPIAESSDVPLPVDAWFPYAVDKWYLFWPTYTHQVILGSSAISAHIAVDTLFVGLLLRMSFQIDILKYRLKKYMDLYREALNDNRGLKAIEKKIILNCIRSHQRIFNFATDLNYNFQIFLVILAVSSLPNICINVYSLSAYKENINVQYVATFFSTTSALLQFFIACWFGNEVFLNSLSVEDAIFQTDWSILNVSHRKLLVFMMARSKRPISFTVGYVIPMNLVSFIEIIKSSYTAFNLLQRTIK